MPMRTITLDGGAVCTRDITNFHPDKTEFLPEEFSVSCGTVEGERVNSALARLAEQEDDM